MKKQMNLRKVRENADRIKELYGQMITPLHNDPERIQKLTKQVLSLQKQDGSFCAADECPTEADSRIGYYYEPTYYGAAALMHAMITDKTAADRAVKESLARALSVAKQRKLFWHGYDATRQQLNALGIFKGAGLYEWVSKYDDPGNNDFHGFCEMIREIISDYRNAVLEGRTYGDWAVDFREDFEKEIEDYEESLNTDVWYACYGSNLSSARFQKYLESCGGDVADMEKRAFSMNGNLYFAADSANWGSGKGVAFLDETSQGTVLSRIYKVSRSQFNSIKKSEGPKYIRKLIVGTVDDIPVYTFTAPQKREDINAPSKEYVQTILRGLRETYPETSETVLHSYLFSHKAISNDARSVLTFIRKAPHAVKIKEIVENRICPGITRVRNAVKFLLGLGLLKKDSRSVRDGFGNGDPEAMYYTEPEKKDVVDLLSAGVI